MENTNNNPFISTLDKKIEQQNKAEKLITKEELFAEYENLKEPFSKVPNIPENDKFGRKSFDGTWYKVLTSEIQQITDGLATIDENTNQGTLKRIKDLIEGVKIRLTANGYMEEGT